MNVNKVMSKEVNKVDFIGLEDVNATLGLKEPNFN